MELLDFMGNSFYAVITIEPVQQIIGGCEGQQIFYGGVMPSYHAARESAYPSLSAASAREGAKMHSMNVLLEEPIRMTSILERSKLVSSLSCLNAFILLQFCLRFFCRIG